MLGSFLVYWTCLKDCLSYLKAVRVDRLPTQYIHKDIQVTLKKQYNQENRILKNLLSGDEWYCQQTFRALNQAVGRCIRHRNDYGAILLLDDRFKKPENIQYMSKWLRKSIRQCENFRESLEGLRTFFKGFETSSDVTKELCIVPTVRSSLVPTHKAKLLITSSTKKPENQPSLKDYITKVKKSSVAVSYQEPNSSLWGRSIFKEQVDIKKGRKSGVGNVSPQVPGEQQSKSHVGQTRLVSGTIEYSKPEITEQNVVIPTMREDPDSDYEVFSLRNDSTFLTKESEMEYVLKETQLGVDNMVMQGCDNGSSIQSAKTESVMVISSEKVLALTRCKEMPQNETLFSKSLVNGPSRNRTKHPMKRKMDAYHEGTTLDVADVSLKRSNSLGLGASVQCKTEIASLQIDINHLTKRIRDQPSPAKEVVVEIKNIEDVEANRCRLDDRTCNDDPKSGSSRCEGASCSRHYEEVQPDDRRQVGTSSLIEKNVHDGQGGMVDLGSPCGLNRNLSRTIFKENGCQFKDSEARSLHNAEARSVGILSGINTDSQRGGRRPTEVEPRLPCDSSPEDPRNADYPKFRPQGSHSICDNAAFVSTDRVDASCSGRDSSKVAILCESCSYPYTDYVQVVYETFNKSYLATLYNGDILCTKVPMLLIEYQSLHSLVKEKLYASIPSELASLDDFRKKSLPNTGVWVREDGCVYEQIFCPHCEDQRICVGVHVAACDQMNLPLMDKVLFFEEYVKVISMCREEMEQCQGEQKIQLPTAQSGISPNMKARAATPAKAKLKLQRTKF